MRSSESGQTLSEYAVVIAGICVVCLIAALFVGGTISARFQGAGDSVTTPSAPFDPPDQPTVTWPTKIEDCENGGWQNFPQFTDEQECIDYVNSLP
jgi:Flp pilus assembly pilin Flp